MGTARLVDHPEHEEPARTVRTEQRPECLDELGGRRRPRLAKPGLPHLVRVLPVIAGKHGQGEQRLVAGSPFRGRAEGRGPAGRLPQMRIRHLFGAHDTLRSVKTEREMPGEARKRWGALQYRDFRFFWAARAISVAGDRISMLALPTVAIMVLQASPSQVGLLNAAGTLAWPALGLFAGVWVDRLRRRQIMVATDLLRAALLASIPLLFALGHLSLLQLLLVTALVGGMTVFFDLASTAHVPSLVPRDGWADANAKLEVAQQAVATGAPGLAGLLITLLSAPFAITVDALSFLVSGLLITATDSSQPSSTVSPRRSLLRDAEEGIRFLVRDRALVRITIGAAISNVGIMMALALQLLFLYRVMRLSPVVVGVCFAVGSLASLVGAVYNRLIMNCQGIYLTMVTH